MQQFQYQTDRRYFAQLAQGFEEPATKELLALGATRIESAYRGLYFSADSAVLYTINYQSRFLSRVLAPLISFRCKDRDELYRATREIDWPALFSLDETFGIFANITGNRKLVHSKFAALCVKDGIVDTFRDRLRRRPNVDTNTPDIWFNLYIEKEHATLSMETSGGSLHKRGYRRKTIAAPMQETLAAVIVASSGWQGERSFYDPMCGSGTLLCEALMQYCHIPSGYLKKQFGFTHLPDFDPRLWKTVKQAADTRIRPLPSNIIAGSDIDTAAVRASLANCSTLPGGGQITITQTDFEALSGLTDTVIVCNPPYGIRMHKDTALEPFYKKLGDFLKQRCTGSEAYIYFGNRALLKHIGLRPAWKKPMRNAGLDGRLAKFELY